MVDPGVMPSVKYIKFSSEFYVPLDYVDQDFISELRAVSDREDQASKIVFMLWEKGFKINGRNRTSRAEVTVVSPDGDEGYFRFDSFYQLECYRGKWSLLGQAYYYAGLWIH